jgi:hypothetical protein
MSKSTLTKEQKARLKVDKDKFDARARGKICIRCQGKPVTGRVIQQTSTEVGVLDYRSWLCQPCATGLTIYLLEVHAARREAERPQREAEAAERKVALTAKQAENRAKQNAVRAEHGMAPLEPEKSQEKKPRKPRAKPADTDGSTLSPDDGSDETKSVEH